MKPTFFSYRTAFILTGITLVFVVGAIAGSVFLTNLKSAVVPDALAGFNTNIINGDYDSYLTWTHSTTLKADDTMAQTLFKLARVPSGYNYTTLTDFNGDGIVDVLYHDLTGSPYKFGIYLNTGNLGVTWAYKCAVNLNAPITYYGDCAG